MSKVILASNGSYLIDKVYPTLGIEQEDFRIAYIITASKGSKDIAYLDRHKQMMTERGYNFEEIDIERKTEEELRRLFSDKNVIHVEGGNTFYLLKVIKERGFDKLIREFIAQGKVYCGTSAGAYICCPTIEMSTWGPKKHEDFGLRDLSAMNLVPFLLKVHYSDEMKELLVTKISQTVYPVRVLRDGQAIIVENNIYTFIGEGLEVNFQNN